MSSSSKKDGRRAKLVKPPDTRLMSPANATAKLSPTRKKLLERAKAALAEMTDEKVAAIRAAALSDPDGQPVDGLLLAKRGRPRSANKKLPVMLRLDPDVVERFKADGEGWQTRMNDALRKAVGLN